MNFTDNLMLLGGNVTKNICQLLAVSIFYIKTYFIIRYYEKSSSLDASRCESFLSVVVSGTV